MVTCFCKVSKTFYKKYCTIIYNLSYSYEQNSKVIVTMNYCFNIDFLVKANNFLMDKPTK